MAALVRMVGHAARARIGLVRAGAVPSWSQPAGGLPGAAVGGARG
jgi:hypothetical protein